MHTTNHQSLWPSSLSYHNRRRRRHHHHIVFIILILKMTKQCELMTIETLNYNNNNNNILYYYSNLLINLLYYNFALLSHHADHEPRVLVAGAADGAGEDRIAGVEDEHEGLIYIYIYI